MSGLKEALAKVKLLLAPKQHPQSFTAVPRHLLDVLIAAAESQLATDPNPNETQQ